MQKHETNVNQLKNQINTLITLVCIKSNTICLADTIIQLVTQTFPGIPQIDLTMSPSWPVEGNTCFIFDYLLNKFD